MSESVKRYRFLIDGSRKDVIIASDYDALAQRCRELEDYIDNHSAVTADYIARLQRTLDERDTLRAERAQLERIARHLVRVYVVDDQSYAPETATDIALARYKEQFK